MEDWAIAIQESEGFPAWLRSLKQYKSFDFCGEFFIKGWSDLGIFVYAPDHGQPEPEPESMGAIFTILVPRKVNVKDGWNTFRILLDWPQL